MSVRISSSLVLHQMMSDHNSSDLAPQRQEMSVENVSSGLVPQGQKASDYDNSDPVPPRQNVVPSADKTATSRQELELLFHHHIAMLRTTGQTVLSRYAKVEHVSQRHKNRKDGKVDKTMTRLKSDRKA
ncbi:hypothetical protein Tco_1182893 [Tanacetum coccineum]